MVPYAKGSPLDPASYDPAGGSNLITKMGIDATRKANYPDEIAGCRVSRPSTWRASSRATGKADRYCIRPRSVSTIATGAGASTAPRPSSSGQNDARAAAPANRR